MAPRASLVQDLWIAGPPRLRARRYGPFEGARVRVLFHPDLGATLDDPPVAAFLDALGRRVDVAGLEPRGHGSSGGHFGPESADDWRSFVADAGRRWPDGAPLVVAGHGLGGSLALAVADDPSVGGVLALAPVFAAPEPSVLAAVLARLELPSRLPRVAVPVFLVAGRHDPVWAPDAASPGPGERLIVATVPADRGALLAAPWPGIVAEWALAVATA